MVAFEIGYSGHGKFPLNVLARLVQFFASGNYTVRFGKIFLKACELCLALLFISFF